MNAPVIIDVPAQGAQRSAAGRNDGGHAEFAVPPFRVGEHNAHYEGAYDDRMLLWRQLGAADKAANIATMLGDNASSINSVLEVGCGTGDVLAQVARLGIGSTYRGVDVTDPEAHRGPDAMTSGLPLDTYDGVRLPYGDNSFDLVYASHVLEHVPDERGFLTELARVAKRAIYLEVPCELNLRTSAANMQPTLDIGHINAYTPESFALTLMTGGLSVEAMELFDFSKDIQHFHGGGMSASIKMAMRRGLLKLSPRIASRIFTYHCGAMCHPQSN
jgi:SAM-dependent methyltransferase